jgi:hypothetical protein
VSDINKVESLTEDRDVEQFRVLADAYSKFAKEAGIDLLPYREAHLPHFSTQTEATRREILSALERCVSICEKTRAEGHGMSDSPALIWAAFKEFGFRPPSDLFSYIDTKSVIEVHSSQGIQIFRNFNFYKYCSYSLEELYCMPWFQLFERDGKIVQDMIALATRVFTGEIKSTVPMNLPVHTVEERFSQAKHRVKLDMKWIAPVFNADNMPAATIVVESIKPVRVQAKFEEPEVRPQAPQGVPTSFGAKRPF